MRFFCLVCAILTSSVGKAQSPVLDFSYSYGSENRDVASSISVNDGDDFYVVGNFDGSVDFDPGPNVVEFTTNLSWWYIQKFSSEGDLDWANYVIGGGNTLSLPVVTSNSEGEVFLAGMFTNQAMSDIDPGSDEIILTSQNDVMVLKISPSGTFLWAKVFGDGGSMWQIATDIHVNTMSEVITTGYFEGLSDFDSGPDSMLMNENDGNQFISKMDSDGNFIWARQIGGAFGGISVSHALDAEGSIYATGWFGDSADFDPGPEEFMLNSVWGIDPYIVKVDENGNLEWAKTFGGIGFNRTHDIQVFGEHLYISGSFSDTCDFDPGQGIQERISAGDKDGFVLKLTLNGELVWVRTFGSLNDDVANDLVVAGDESVICSGTFGLSVDFDPGSEDFVLTASSSFDPDGFLWHLDSEGDFIWAGQMGAGMIMDMDTSDNLYGAGFFTDTVDLDPSPYSESLHFNTWPEDAFVLKLNMDSLLTSAVNQPAGNAYEVFAYPNPSTGTFNISVSESLGSITATVSDLAGSVVQTQTFNSSSFSLDFDGESGIYLLELEAEDERAVLKLLKE